MKKKFNILKYPRLLLLAAIFIVSAWFLYKGKTWAPLYNLLNSLNYFGLFLAGMLYSYGFTAAPATAILMVISEGKYLPLALLIAGAGALISDIIIYFFVKSIFVQEIQMLTKEKVFKTIFKENNKKSGYIRKILPLIAGGIIVASPLPTEMGITILATNSSLSTRGFIILAGLLHFVGISIILSIGQNV